VSAQNAATRRWYTARRRELRELLWEWDPLGLMGAPVDEYDSLVDRMLSALINRRDDDAVAAAVVEGLSYMGDEGYSAASADRHSQPAELDPFLSRVRQWWRTAPPSP